MGHAEGPAAQQSVLVAPALHDLEQGIRVEPFEMPDGTQKIEDTGPLTKKRMETADDETSDRAVAFIKEQHKAGKP